jgi:glycyl-tRNA synthetase
MVTNPPIGPDGREVQMVGVDCSIIMNPKVWEASGHATGFADPMVDDKETKQRFRADNLFGLFPAPGPLHRAVVVGTELSAKGYGLPIATVVASSAAEATLEFQANRKLVHNLRTLEVDPDFERELDSRRRTAGAVRFVRMTMRDGSCHQAAVAEVFKQVEPRYVHLVPSPFSGKEGVLTEPRQFNLMFKTHYGALEDASSLAYLRPETAQGIFVNYKNVLDTTRVKVPFGIAQVGKSFRNEINPRNYTFRSREFEQMEIEFFCRGAWASGPSECSHEATKGEVTDMDWYAFWRKVRYDWYVNLGLKSEKLRLRDQGPEELAHYSKACADIEYLFPFSDEHQELEGVAHRGNFDLTQHQKFSGKDLTYFDDERWQAFVAQRKADGLPELSKEEKAELSSKPPYRFLPTVIEPSAGADRAALAFLCEAYCEDQAPDEKGVMQTRVVMKFHPKLAPIKVAVFPLVNKEAMPNIAEAIYKDAKKHMTAFYDDKGAIGRRYRRQDEAGTPFCVTIDGDTLKDGTVTIRDRDTLAQIRVHKDNVVAWLKEKLAL